MESLARTLKWYYIGTFTAFFVTALCCIYLIEEPIIELGSSTAISIQSLGIMYVIVSVPSALYFFHRKIKDIATKPNKMHEYKFASLLRLFLIAFGVILNVVFFYLLKDTSMLYAAAISAVAFLFCRPDKHKIEQDLNSSVAGSFDEDTDQNDK